MWNQSRMGDPTTPASARMRWRFGQPSVKAVNAVLSARPTASRLRRISARMSVPALATAPKTWRLPDGVSTLPTRTFRCRAPSAQLRMNVESKVTTIADAAVSGLIVVHSSRTLPTFRVRRRKVS